MDDFINPAVQGTLGLLKSASKSPSVKRVVITSSIAVLDLEKASDISGRFPSLFGLIKGNVKLTHQTAYDLGPIPPLDKLTTPFAGYVASKRVALKKTNEFVEQNKPGFDIIHVLPSVILGRNELTTTLPEFDSGTNRYVINIAKGETAPAPMLGASVFVDDCAEVHVQALNSKVQGNQNFIASSGAVVFNDVNEIVKEAFGSTEKSVLKLGGNLATKALDLNTRETDDAFHIRWASFPEQVKSVIGHYLEVVGDEA